MAKKETKYIVVQDFKDLEDKNKVYSKGDVYPNPANKKIEELISSIFIFY